MKTLTAQIDREAAQAPRDGIRQYRQPRLSDALVRRRVAAATTGDAHLCDDLDRITETLLKPFALGLYRSAIA